MLQGAEEQLLWVMKDKVSFTLSVCILNYVSHFNYLGQVICDTLKDDEDIKQEIKNLYVANNALNRFSKSSKNVKLTLFRNSVCQCMMCHFGNTILLPQLINLYLVITSV